MKIYTRTGDQGETGLFGGSRVRKNDARVEAYGTVDELNAALGLALGASVAEPLRACLSQIQEHLFVLGAEVACVPEKVDKLRMQLLSNEEIVALENLIDEHEASLPPLSTFILPGGSPAGSALHLARTVARRAERRCLDVLGLRPEILVYLNRLSDALFVLARRENQLSSCPETAWLPPRG